MSVVRKLEMKGRQKGRQEDIIKILKLRFRRAPKGLGNAVRSITNERRLDALLASAATCKSIEDFAASL